jgi:hypothetical protein
MSCRKVVMFIMSVAVGGCSAAEKRLDDLGGLDAGPGDTVKGPGDDIDVGDSVDVDGDGDSEGVAVDVDGDGEVDGVDGDGDGSVDMPLPEPSADAGADGGGTTPAVDAAGVPFPVDKNGNVLCDGSPCACSDGEDDDDDGLIDLADPECVSSWDNDENSFATGIPGDNRDEACQDCFFDGNSGSGNDGCRLPSSCIREGNASSGQGSCNSCEQTAQCVNFCKAYTPNGCDCFGCCSVRLADESVVNVMLGNGCSIDGNSVEGCTTCVQNDSCRNECGRCELCPGKTPADLPSDCTAPPPSGDGGVSDGGYSDGGVGEDGGYSEDGGPVDPPPPTYSCDDGATRCGADLPECEAGSACQFGCCVLIPILLF